MIFKRSKEVLIIALLFASIISDDVNSPKLELEPETKQTTVVNESDSQTLTSENNNQTIDTSTESDTIVPPEDSKLNQDNEILISSTNNIIEPITEDNINKDESNVKGEEVNETDIVVKPVVNEEIEIKQPVQSDQIKERLTFLGLLLFLSSTLTCFGVIVLIFSTIYYRIYLKQNKSAPFETPAFLSLFFPKPVNYEYEINNLCSKYLDN